METNQKDYIDGYATEKRKARRKGSKATNEFFTPATLVLKMCDKIPEEYWSDNTKTFLEPAAGNGAFVYEIIKRRINAGVSYIDALRTLYSVELMQDNVDELKRRILELLDEIVIEYDKDIAMQIMNNNMVCSDFFKWDFDNWCPLPELPLKSKKKK